MQKKYLIILLILSSCASQKRIDWGLDFQVYNTKYFDESLILIPKTKIDNLETKSPLTAYSNSKIYKYDSFKDYLVEVDSFYMFRYEVTNKGYLTFLSDLKTYDREKYKLMLPDTQVWRSKFNFNEPYIEYYLRNPALKDFPVVGVSHEQANEYCKWLTKVYNSRSDRKHKNAVFKLPTKAQWFVAAIGNNHERLLPWDGMSVQDNAGNWRANFYKIEQIQIRRDTGFIECHNNSRYLSHCLKISNSSGEQMSLNDIYRDGHGITSHVRSFEPNDYGLYNMSGNVEEYVREGGITKGGSWNDTGYYLLLNAEQHYDWLNNVSSEIGFRIVMELE